MLNDAQHMTFDGPWLLEVRCRGCGVTTMKRERGDRVAMPTPAYAELAIEMRLPDGRLAKHETGMCKTCRDRILAAPEPGELRAIFASDIKHMMRAAMRAGHPRATVAMIAERLAQWTPMCAIGPGRISG